jgi:hypothetical protein
MWHRSKSLNVAILAAGTYAILWALTHFVGGPQVRNLSLSAMHLPDGLSGFTETSQVHRPSDNSRTYFCRAFAYAPFVVRIDHGWASGSLSGDGGSELYLWAPGVKFRIYELDHWGI